MNTDSPSWRLFLLADAQGPPYPHLRLLKVTAADCDPGAAVPKNSWVSPQRYFGWINMRTTANLNLYKELNLFQLKQIVNRTSGGSGAFWKPMDD
jgi:hypothetical protein